jgi:hypothetical protein
MKNKKLKYKSDEPLDLEELAPNLSKLKKSYAFKVPDNYFEKLPMEILFKVSQPEKVTAAGKLYSIFQQPKYSIAAAVAVLLIVVTVMLFNKPDSVISPVLVDFTLEDILLENPDLIETMDETLLLETLVAGSGEELDQFLDTTSVLNHGVDDEELFEYLSGESLTPELLYDL